MLIVGVSFCVILASLLGLVLLHREDKIRARVVRGAAVKHLTTGGLIFSGEPFASFELRGQLEGVNVELRNRVRRRRPGPSREEPIVCVLSFDSRLPEQITCKTADIDLVMGVLPTVLQVRTADPSFDAAYATFVMAGANDAVGHFRAAPGSHALNWAKQSILSQMQALDLLWFRVQDGHAELVFPPLANGLIARALALGVNFARISNGEPAVVLAPTLEEPANGAHIPAVDPGESIGIALGGLVMSAFVGGVFLPRHPWLRAMNESSLCGTGGPILMRTSYSGRGTSDHFHCSSNPDDYLLLHPLSSVMLVYAAILVVTLATVLYRTSRHRANSPAK